jgi:hypothetical protein
MATKLTVQFNLFVAFVLNYKKHHDAFNKLTTLRDDVLTHRVGIRGNNAVEMETTATYDPKKTQEFVAEYNPRC